MDDQAVNSVGYRVTDLLVKPKFWFLIALATVTASVPVTAGAFQALVFFTFLYIGLSSAWNIIGGYAGQISFGHAAFYGLGAYTTAILTIGNVSAWPKIPALATIPLAGIVAALYALLIGYATLRLRGPYFSIATIGVGEATRLLMLNAADLTGGASGLIFPPPPDYRRYALTYFYIGFGWMVVVLLVSWWIRNSRFGLGLFAVNMDTDAAETLGVNTSGSKIIAFMVSAFLVGVSCSIYAQYIFFIYPNTVFGFSTSISMILMATIGGIGTFWGPVLGAIIFYVVDNRLATTTVHIFNQTLALGRFNLLLYGLLLVGIILGEPRGLVGIGERIRRRAARRAEHTA